MQNNWGVYPWFLEDGIDKIHPDDLDNFKRESNNCKVFECLGEEHPFIIIKYGDKSFRVKNDVFRSVPAPKYHIGDRVELLQNSVSNLVISDIMWHYEKKEHYYHISVNGKKKSKRYFEAEFRNP